MADLDKDSIINMIGWIQSILKIKYFPVLLGGA